MLHQVTKKRKIRLARTQTRMLAKMLGVSHPHVSRVARGLSTSAYVRGGIEAFLKGEIETYLQEHRRAA